MTEFYGTTDTPIRRSRFYRFRKRFLRPSTVFFLLLIALWLVVPRLARETPVKNAIRHISVRRNRILVHFNPETVADSLCYAFHRCSDTTFVLDIADGHLPYEWDQTFGYGDVARISRRKTKKDSARLMFTFSNLRDTPSVCYVHDPPSFELLFNRYLDSLFIVVLDPGHGGDNRGAVGSAGSVEKDVMLPIVLRLEELLQKRDDIRTYVTRRTDRSVGLFRRSNMANTLEADLFLSLHANSARNREANHSEVYYLSSRSLPSATIMLREMERAFGNGRGFVRRRGYAVLRGNLSRIAALLVELMYLSNDRGEAFLADARNHDRIARTLYAAVERILEESR